MGLWMDEWSGCVEEWIGGVWIAEEVNEKIKGESSWLIGWLAGWMDAKAVVVGVSVV